MAASEPGSGQRNVAGVTKANRRPVRFAAGCRPFATFRLLEVQVRCEKRPLDAQEAFLDGRCGICVDRSHFTQARSCRSGFEDAVI